MVVPRDIEDLLGVALEVVTPKCLLPKPKVLTYSNRRRKRPGQTNRGVRRSISKGDLFTMNILHLDSSVTGANSISRPLSKETTLKLQRDNPGACVVYRDLVEEPIGHYTAVKRLFAVDAPNLTAEQKLELETGERILQEFLSADIIVVGAPMYNFTIPSQLKAWIDLICVARVTFRYGDHGPVGLCGGKMVVIISTRGRHYAEGSLFELHDFQEKYLKDVFGFLGITNVQVVRAEGLAEGPEKTGEAVSAARRQIAELGTGL